MSREIISGKVAFAIDPRQTVPLTKRKAGLGRESIFI